MGDTMNEDLSSQFVYRHSKTIWSDGITARVLAGLPKYIGSRFL
jgi:hypothetical protein